VTFRGGSPISSELNRLAEALIAAVKELEEKYRKVCLDAGNANTKIYQLLKDAGPLHFYELILRSNLSRRSVHRALMTLRMLGLVQKDEETDTWRAV